MQGILVFIFILCKSSTATLAVQYITTTKIFSTTDSNDFFTRTLGHQFDTNVRIGGKNSTAGETDDTPLELLPLGFPFHYYGKRTTSVWVNPNGGLQFIPKPPCGCCFSSMTYTGYCDFNSSYYDMVSLSVTDLAPIDGPDCYVRYNTMQSSSGGGSSGSGSGSSSSDDDTFGLIFLNVPLFGVDPRPGPTWTFGATLSKNGKIEASYLKIFDTLKPPNVGSHTTFLPNHVENNWLVGLRAPKEYNAAYQELHPTVSVAHQHDWKTSITGAYPKRSNIQQGTRITYCPVPTEVCVKPSRGVQGGGVGTETLLRLTGNSLFGCGQDMILFCRFHLPNSLGGTLDTPATIISATEDPLQRTVTCSTPTSAAVTIGAAAAGWIDVSLVYIAHAGKYDDVPPFSNVQKQQIPLQQSISSTLSSSSSSSNLRFEFIVSASSSAAATDTCQGEGGITTGAAVANCDVCGVCGGQNLCTTATCNGKYGSSVDCAGSCNGPGVKGTDGKCCESPLYLDCNGICNGTSVEAWVRFPSILAKGCCPLQRIDCTGLCDGSAKIDRCGKCAGGTTGFIPNDEMDCLGLCPNDPKKQGMNQVDCNPDVDIGGSDSAGGDSTAGQGGSHSSGGTNPNISDHGRAFRWEIDNTNLDNSDLKPQDLIKSWPLTVQNVGPIRIYLNNIAVTNSPKDKKTHPPVFLEYDIFKADFGENVWIVESNQTIVINITVDMRTVLLDPIVQAPRRPKALRFQYTYGGPKSSVFSVVIPIEVCLMFYDIHVVS